MLRRLDTFCIFSNYDPFDYSIPVTLVFKKFHEYLKKISPRNYTNSLFIHLGFNSNNISSKIYFLLILINIP